MKAKYSVSQKNLESHNVRACKLETRYEFITYKSIDDSKKSVNSFSVILGDWRKVITDQGAWIAHGLGIKLKIQTNRRQFGEGWQQWVKAEKDWNMKKT